MIQKEMRWPYLNTEKFYRKSVFPDSHKNREIGQLSSHNPYGNSWLELSDSCPSGQDPNSPSSHVGDLPRLQVLGLATLGLLDTTHPLTHVSPSPHLLPLHGSSPEKLAIPHDPMLLYSLSCPFCLENKEYINSC